LASGGELDREGAGRGHVTGGHVPAHGAYSAWRARTTGLCSGLGTVLSAAIARPAERAVQGHRSQAVGTRFWLA
jgi:hypothetical protein